MGDEDSIAAAAHGAHGTFHIDPLQGVIAFRQPAAARNAVHALSNAALAKLTLRLFSLSLDMPITKESLLDLMAASLAENLPLFA